MRLSLGPLLYYWPQGMVRDYYGAMAAEPVDVVYLGETVCSRRHEMRFSDWLELAEELLSADKEVVLSSQALLESESDLKTLRRLVEEGRQGRMGVEANDMGAVRLLEAAGVPFIAGPTLNIFNGHTLKLLADMGATRWAMAPEMDREQLAGILAEKPAGMETEVFAFGRLPLAWSARCFTARHFNLQKDSCEFRCLAYPDGLALRTREGEGFLTLNGIQTQSAKVYNLLAELPELKAMGIDILRLSPQSGHMGEVIRTFRAALDDQNPSREHLDPLQPAPSCNGFWYGRPGLDLVETTATAP